MYVAGQEDIYILEAKTGSIIGNPIKAGNDISAISITKESLYVSDSANNTVSEIDLNTFSIKPNPFRTGEGPIAIKHIAHKIYVANERDNSLTVIDTRTKNVWTISLSGSPKSLASFGYFLYAGIIAESGPQIIEIDIRNDQIKRPISFAFSRGYKNVKNIKLSSFGDNLFYMVEYSGDYSYSQAGVGKIALNGMVETYNDLEWVRDIEISDKPSYIDFGPSASFGSRAVICSTSPKACFGFDLNNLSAKPKELPIGYRWMVGSNTASLIYMSGSLLYVFFGKDLYIYDIYYEL